MKTGLDIVALATEIARRAESKKDIVTSTTNLQMVVTEDAKDVQLSAGPKILEALGDFPVISDVNNIAHKQIAEFTGVPAKYYDRMRTEQPDLLALNVNRWFAVDAKPRLVRALDGRIRAMLSNGYRPLENEDLAEVVLPILLEDKDLEIASCDITETRLYIKAVSKRIKADVPKGATYGEGHVIYDTLSPAVIITNSEVGFGNLAVDFGVYTKACTNLATFNAAGEGMKRRHVGARNVLGDNQEIMHLLSDRTKRATDKAVWLQTADVVRAALDEARFMATIERIKDTAQRKIQGDVQKAVDVTVAHFGMSKGQGSSILRHLIEGGSLTQYGLFNAVTRTAQDQDSYDDASDLERIGAKIVDLAPGEWRTISEAKETPKQKEAA
jgi:hypothetical protein